MFMNKIKFIIIVGRSEVYKYVYEKHEVKTRVDNNIDRITSIWLKS